MRLRVILVCTIVYVFLAGCSNEAAENKKLNQYATKELTSTFEDVNNKVTTANEDIYIKNINNFLQKKESKEDLLESLVEYKEDIKKQQEVLKRMQVSQDLSKEHKKEIQTLYKDYRNILNENITAVEQIESKVNKGKTVTNSDYLITKKRISQSVVTSNVKLIDFMEVNNLTTVKRNVNLKEDNSNNHMDHENMDHENMDHENMDHENMDHENMDHENMDHENGTDSKDK